MNALNRLVASTEALFLYIRLTIGIESLAFRHPNLRSRMIRGARTEDRREKREREREIEGEKDAVQEKEREEFNSGAKHMQIHSSIPRQWDLCDGTIAAILV